MSNPQRPTESRALIRLILAHDPPELEMIYRAEIRKTGAALHEVGYHSPLWFDADEDVEIENPDDEAPDTDQ